MKLKADSNLVEFAYWSDNLPSHTNLCKLFWRTVFHAAVLFGILGWFATAIYYTDSPQAYMTLVLGSFAVLVFLLKWFSEWKGDATEAYLNRTVERVKAAHLTSLLVAIKHKACPIIEIEQ